MRDLKVILLDSIGFASLYDTQRLAKVNRQIEEVAALSEQRAGQGLATEQLHRRRDVLQRHAASLNPLHRRLCVNAIQVTLLSGEILTHRCAPDISTALASHWGPVFTAQPVDTEGGLRYAHTHLAPWDFSTVREVRISDFVIFLRRARASAPGPDGISYGFWRAAGYHAAQTLWLVDTELKSGASPPFSFNESCMVFPPKGELDDDSRDVVRTPSSVRPISLKNVITR